MRLIPRDSRREQIFVAVVGSIIHLILRGLGATTRSRYVGADSLLGRFAAGEPLILAFWHGRMVMMPFGYRGRGACIMNSRHRDGALISRAIEPFGIEVVRGSSSRGWVGGIKGLLEAAEKGKDLVVVPDGPRGPRCRAKSGVVQLARATQLPIYPVSCSASRHRILRRSWDWLCIPLPGAQVVYAVEEPLRISSDAGGDEVEEACAELERRLNRATERADREVGLAPGFTADFLAGKPNEKGS